MKRYEKKNEDGETKRGRGGLFRGKRKFIVIPVLLLLIAGGIAAFLFRDRLFPPKEAEEEKIEEPKPVKAPVQYKLQKEVEVLALPAGDHVLVYDATPEEPPFAREEEETAEAELLSSVEPENPAEEDGEEPAEEPEEEEEPEVTAIGYRYEGVKNAAGLALAYATLLTTEDMGFRLVNEELREPTEEDTLPDFTAAEGEALLFLELPLPEDADETTEPQAVAMRLSWEEGICTVLLDIVPVPEELRPENGPQQTITFSEAVDRFKAMHPSVLGLPGDSMESYQVYSMNGMVLINDQPCMHLDVYSVDETTQTNVMAGCYYISSDGTRLYELNPVTNIMTELAGAPTVVLGGLTQTLDTAKEAADSEIPEEPVD